jgi:glucan phosphorylase
MDQGVGLPRRPETLAENRWGDWLDRISRPDLGTVIDDMHPVVYTSAEYGLDNMVSAGGLGMLSRDHYRTAFDLGMPCVCIGHLHANRKQQSIETDGS